MAYFALTSSFTATCSTCCRYRPEETNIGQKLIICIWSPIIGSERSKLGLQLRWICSVLSLIEDVGRGPRAGPSARLGSRSVASPRGPIIDAVDVAEVLPDNMATWTTPRGYGVAKREKNGGFHSLRGEISSPALA
ncbi:hypothetical protein HN011_005373 [Eciton burchellii]|nr:hypothetical protein HN011_005373 [Eciton burchellii]